MGFDKEIEKGVTHELKVGRRQGMGGFSKNYNVTWPSPVVMTEEHGIFKAASVLGISFAGAWRVGRFADAVKERWQATRTPRTLSRGRGVLREGAAGS